MKSKTLMITKNAMALSLWFSLGGVSVSLAADIPEHHCAVVVASRQTMDEVKQYVAEQGFAKEKITIYPASNKWLAISVGVLPEKTATPTLKAWKAKGKVPKDSFCTKGTNLKNGTPLVAKSAQRLFDDGRCAVIVASRQSVEEAKNFISENALDRKKTQVYPAANGWFAIGIDIIDLKDKDKILPTLKDHGLIPPDSYCTTGKNYQPALRNLFSSQSASQSSEKSGAASKSATAPEKQQKNQAKEQREKQQKPQSPYAFQGQFSDGLAVVNKHGKWGFINRQEKEVIAPQYGSARAFNVGVAVVGKGDAYALINKQGELVTGFDFSNIGMFRDGVAIAQKNHNVGVVNARGEVVVPFEYQSISAFKNGVAFAVKDGKKIVLNSNGDVSDNYDYIGAFRQGLAPVSQAGRWGYINREGKEVVKPQFEYAEPFYNDRARIKQVGKYGYVDKQGKMVIAAQFDYAENFGKRGARVEKDGTTILIDKGGFQIGN